MATSGEDPTLVALSPDEFQRGDWNEWMQWDPASQNHTPKSLNAQGPLCYLKPGQRPPIYNRRRNSQLRDSSLGLPPNTTPTSQPMSGRVNSTPYSFGENVDHTPAFHFDGSAISPSPVGETSQNNGFFQTSPVWDQQQGDNPIFSPNGFEQPRLQGITMAPQSTPSLQHSPDSITNMRTSSSSSQSSPEPAQTGNTKKRKSAAEEDVAELKKDKQPPVKKTAHNMIEKRYRTNLNDKIAALRDSVPSLRVMSRGNGTVEEEDDPEDLEGLTPAHKLNKATVLSKATEYIRHLEKRNKRLTDDLHAMKMRLDSYEKMPISAPMAMANAVNTPEGLRYQDDPFGSSVQGPPVSGPPQGMIPVPENMANLHRGMAQGPHFAPQNNSYPVYTTAPGRPGMPGPPLVNGRRNNGMVGKLMVGSLAGLMIMEGLSEREQLDEEPAGRGLFSLPINIVQFLTPRVSVGGVSTQLSLLPLVKLVLVLGAVFYIFAPLFDFKPKSRKKTMPGITLSPAPSLASPVEVRQKAWLTAIQTVWVPRHNFLLEAAALGLKTLKLSTRKVIGWHGYALLTGTTKEQEAARIKAWEIALDAQLTGGDAEISWSRLILTLMASGTLPDTPARLMLKALHIRVLLSEVANAGYGSWYMFEELSAKISRHYWNAARIEHRILAGSSSKDNKEVEPLPDHLAALLNKECDEVLIDSIIQRAYNLAWNKPSADNTTVDESMDGVVEDFAISSTLDALAAWYSSFVLSRALVGYLATDSVKLTDNVKQDLDLATCTAPPTSCAKLRALVAKAVLIDEDRSTHINAAFRALPSQPSSTTLEDNIASPRAVLMNLVGDTPIAAEIRTALTLAKCLALVESSNDEARLRATFVVNGYYLPESSVTILSFVAGYKTINYFLQDETVRAESKQGLERMSSSLRVWIGREAGRRSGLQTKTRGKIVERCLDISKMLVGMGEITEDTDAGYVSQSDNGDDIDVEKQ